MLLPWASETLFTPPSWLAENLDLTMTSLSCFRANVQVQCHGLPTPSPTPQSHLLCSVSWESSSLAEVMNDLVPKLGTEMR